MSDRKYRQHGYQDSGPRERPAQAPRKAPEPHDPRIPRDPKTPNLPGFRETFRCARCGHVETSGIESASRCAKCGVELHACIHCASFDPGAVYECREKIASRVSPKDTRNECALFAPRVQVERETRTAAPASARKAFDDLFKF